MNVITIRGGRKSQRELIKASIEFSLNKLLPRTTSLDIEVRLNRRIEDAEGYCLSEDHKTFELEMDPRLSDKELAITVFHEMVHVRQYFKRQLRDEAFGNVKTWLGKMYCEDAVGYYKLPWEKRHSNCKRFCSNNLQNHSQSPNVKYLKHSTTTDIL